MHILTTRGAEKAIKATHPRTQKKLRAHIEDLKDKPDLSNLAVTKHSMGAMGTFAYTRCGNWRVLMILKDDEAVITGLALRPS